MQTSLVLSQRTWPGVGDLDDCWVLSTLQCVLACAPWEHLPGTTPFRKAAGDPDDGNRDGGSINEILKAVGVLWPEVRTGCSPLRGVAWDALKTEVQKGRPVSVALMAGKLPAKLRYGTGNVAHQCTLAMAGATVLFANPMAQMGSKWDEILWTDVKDAILGYGNGTVYGIAFPTPASLARSAPGYAKALTEDIAKLPKPDCSTERAAGFAEAKAKAQAAVAAI